MDFSPWKNVHHEIFRLEIFWALILFDVMVVWNFDRLGRQKINILFQNLEISYVEWLNCNSGKKIYVSVDKSKIWNIEF